MTGALDTTLRAKALSIIARVGKAASWASVASSYSESTRRSTETVTSYSVTISPPFPFDVSVADGVTIQTSDLRTLIAASGLVFTPSIGDRITIDSATYSVVNVTPIYSGELVAAYEVQCRK